jgi:hypothetical protein
MGRRAVLVLALAAVLAMAGVPVAAAQPTLVAEPTCSYPESDAEALVVLSDFHPDAYWWDHTDLTVAVQAPSTAWAPQRDAVSAAIETWHAVLDECFDGLITLTELPAGPGSDPLGADIVVHLGTTAGGEHIVGAALCGDGRCPTVTVRSEPGPGVGPYAPQFVYWTTMHELGHALGIGHATNLLESTDLMGYGWIGTSAPVLSDCDVDALAHVFGWALRGEEPTVPAPGPVDCTES